MTPPGGPFSSSAPGARMGATARWPAYGTPWPGAGASDPSIAALDTDPAGWAAAPMARGSLALFLALYLLLLAFFIMLTALSSLESERSRAVMDSLTVTFSRAAPEPPTRVTVLLEDLSGQEQAAETFIALVQQVFDAAAPTVQVRHLISGRSIEVLVRGNSMFRPGADTLRPGQLGMLDALVAALSSPPPGLRFEMAAVLQTGPADTPDAAAVPLPVSPQALPVRRAGVLGRTMNARGAPPGSVVVGLEPGEAGWVRLTFRAVDVARWHPDLREAPADAVPIDAPDPAADSGAPPVEGAQPGAPDASLPDQPAPPTPPGEAAGPADPQRTPP
ncbi:hypothetical protein [Roseospira navarrensis]|uniref:Motility protein B-like N-terminal domain-containing protein n=1 Tax=Roseospira navarrensis TaxID=140058 RepID=A0A7X2D4Z9_9PROT|nr:hypothetical protein [Roseospira navarrensis]MQX38361.1 hypothetical protein [Roseospira navarrensis]